MAKWNEITAVFGGTFDPPHVGHIAAVRGLFERPGVGRVIVLPSPVPPQKPAGVTETHARAHMVRLTFGDRAKFPGPVLIDSREILRSQLHPGLPSFTYDTLQQMRGEIPNLAFVIGADQFYNLPTWHRFPDLLDLCHWIVLERKPNGADLAGKALSEFVANGLAKPQSSRSSQSSMTSETWTFGRAGKSSLTIIPTDAPSISSTEIRETIGRTGHPPENGLTPEVLEYLKLHRVYGTAP